jgi:hypothetical protein
MEMNSVQYMYVRMEYIYEKYLNVWRSFFLSCVAFLSTIFLLFFLLIFIRASFLYVLIQLRLSTFISTVGTIRGFKYFFLLVFNGNYRKTKATIIGNLEYETISKNKIQFIASNIHFISLQIVQD